MISTSSHDITSLAGKISKIHKYNSVTHWYWCDKAFISIGPAPC